jgi:hypothetical protein
VRLHYRLIGLIVFDKFIDRPALKDFSFHPEKLFIENAPTAIVSPSAGVKVANRPDNVSKYFFFWFISCMLL